MAVRRMGVAGVVAGLLVAGLSAVPGGAVYAAADPGMSIAPMPVTAVSLAQAGEVVQWQSGESSDPMAEVPASLAGVAVTQVALADKVGFAVTAAGRLVSWGGNQARLQNIPDEVAATPVAQVATAVGNYAGVVTQAGEVKVWGTKRNFETPLDVPDGLTGVKQLALTNDRALALRNDGTVVGWGIAGDDPGEPPPGLKATAIAVNGFNAYALTVDGAVVGWGDDSGPALDLPSEVADPEPGKQVVSVAAASGGGYALLADGTLKQWGYPKVPAGVTAVDPVAVVGGKFAAVVDGEGVIHHWRAAPTVTVESGYVPVELNGRALSQLALGYFGAGAVVITKMLRGADPVVNGTPHPGQTLTGTPGTFSGSPEGMTVTSRWLADGAPMPGVSGATLPLTEALVGKKITYESTATKAGEATVVSTSAPVTVVKPAPPAPTKVASKTAVKVKVAKKAKKVVVAAKVRASKSPAGKAKVTIAKGKKKIVAKNVKVNAKGKAKLKVKKFNKLVAKKTKAKGKKAKKRAYRGKYKVVVKYLGNAQVEPSKAGKKLKIKK